ncbi:MAG TPA: hypothetical protein VFZ67_04155 [Nitrososphaera sp.]
MNGRATVKEWYLSYSQSRNGTHPDGKRSTTVKGRDGFLDMGGGQQVSFTQNHIAEICTKLAGY